jgi:hypothetical protein
VVGVGGKGRGEYIPPTLEERRLDSRYIGRHKFLYLEAIVREVGKSRW